MCGRIITTFVVAIIGVLALSEFASSQSRSTLPSAQTESAIQSLTIDSPTRPRNRGGRNAQPDARELLVDPQKVPPAERDKLRTNSQGVSSAPLFIPNTLLIQFDPTASKESIDELLKRRKLKVVETFAKLGIVKVEADLSRYFAPELTDNNANETLLRGVSKIIDDFNKEPIVRSATPDAVLRPNAEDVKNLLKASDVGALALVDNNEVVDWGIKNIEADQVWDVPGAQDGVLFGVMDVGFGRHEDISFIEPPSKLDIHDHGNHVAAIGCGRHGNARGLRGVLPNCFVRPRTGDVFFSSIEGGDVTKFFVIFSQIIRTFHQFVDQFDDLHVINLSMGYNWRSNFGINPDLPESTAYRSMVEQQGLMLISVLELADKAGKMIFSAAGNDSSGLAKPINARFASPFNWAALTARERAIARNGVVVEAHDSSNKRAPFSNVGGHVSCPGVDVVSAVAHDSARKPSNSSYGKMSGTSMASPYCASALLLLGLVRPGYSGAELTDCLLASTVKSDTGVPIPKLTQALAKCPPRN